MTKRAAYDFAVGLLEPFHEAVEKRLMEQAARCDDAVPCSHVMRADEAGPDTAFKQPGVLIEPHALEEREQIFLRACQAAYDSRRVTVPQLRTQATASACP